MDLLLVLPPALSTNIDGLSVPKAPRLGLAYLAAYIKQHGHSVLTLDCISEGLTLEEAATSIFVQDPLVVGITIIYNYVDFVPATELITLLREMGYSKHITVGGYTATLEWDTILCRFEGIDSVVMGEGEVTAEELLQCIKSGGNLSAIKGLALRINGNPALTPPRELLQDLDLLPFPIRHANGMNGEAHISGSRGCYGACSFCSIQTFYGYGKGQRWRARSPGHIVAEMKEIMGTFGVTNFYFVDDNFIGPGSSGRKRAVEFAELLIEDRMNVTFGISCRANDIERAAFNKLKRSGLCSVFLGVESGVQRQLDAYNKQVTVEQNRTAIKILHELGLNVSAGFIPFDPDVTLEEFSRNVQFMRENKMYRNESGLYNLFVQLYPFPGTPVYSRLLSEGRLSVETSREGYQLCHYKFSDNRIAALRDAIVPLFYKLMASYDIVVKALDVAEETKQKEEWTRLRRWIDSLGLLGISIMQGAIGIARLNTDCQTIRDNITIHVTDFVRAHSFRHFSHELVTNHPVLIFEESQCGSSSCTMS
jgi:radical SAM superfamily enzyme YgiQ (UPF0313 family)